MIERVGIGYCIDSFDVGGTELNAVRTLEALDRERFAVTVFHLHADGPLRERYRRLEIPLVHLPIGPLYAPRTLRAGLKFVRVLRQRRIRIVHTHDLYTNIFAAPWAAAMPGRALIASRRWLYDAPRPGLVTLNRWSYRFADRVLANSAAVARLLAEEERLPPRKIVELPNFLEESAFQRVGPAARAAERARWGVPADAWLVGVVARLAPVKNLELLLRAAAELAADVHVVLVGDGPARPRLQALAAALGLGARVHFLGERLAPTNQHQYFDASVLCSRSEGFPNSIIEALAAARPVVATPVGGVTEVVVDGETGLLVPVDAPGELADRLRRLRADPGLASRLGEAGLARVRGKYHRSTVISKLEGLYAELSGGVLVAQARTA